MLVQAGARELESGLRRDTHRRVVVWVERGAQHREAQLAKRITDELTGKLGRQAPAPLVRAEAVIDFRVRSLRRGTPPSAPSPAPRPASRRSRRASSLRRRTAPAPSDTAPGAVPGPPPGVPPGPPAPFRRRGADRRPRPLRPNRPPPAPGAGGGGRSPRSSRSASTTARTGGGGPTGRASRARTLPPRTAPLPAPPVGRPSRGGGGARLSWWGIRG